jgi:hypothetical protein
LQRRSTGPARDEEATHAQPAKLDRAGEHRTAPLEGRLIDFVDTGHPALLRMWDKRQRGYRAMGYRIAADASPYESPL